MKKIAVISAVLEDPALVQQQFNETISNFKGIVKGRLGIPFDEQGVSIISLTVIASLDEINSLTGKLGKLPQVYVKTAISKKEFDA